MTNRISEPFRVWIHTDFFLEVDRDGYILGTCYEGALGCVVPLLSASGRTRLALKIPRMLADTVRENAYISQVVAAESVIVHRANEEFRAGAGLIPVEKLGRNILRGTRELKNAPNAEAKAQDGCVLLFHFRKDRNPRVCAVKYEGDRQVVFPPDCEVDLSYFTHELWDRVMDASRNYDAPESASYYFEIGRRSPTTARSGTVVHSPLVATMTTSEWPEVWFAALPSILYNWANGTLQEAVSQGRLEPWTIDQHYELCCRVLRGVDTLHSKRFIHGDLRPANIMVGGPANVPEDYMVGDYGSFSEDFSQLGGPQSNNSGHTMVGGLGRHRASVFYAPERRAGVERETADVALILSTIDDVPVKDEYLIYFGWRSCLIDPRTNAPDERLLRTLRADWRRMRETTAAERPYRSTDRLTRGDRLRVREFIFTVLDADEFVDEDAAAELMDAEVPAAILRARARRMVVRCAGRFAQVVHERLTVYGESAPLQDCMVVGLPNYVELRQWSVATDLYGAGALILYTMFMSGLQRGIPVAADSPAGPREDAMSNAETMLPQVLEVLEGLPSFLALWSDLEDFRWNLEHPENAGLSGTDLAQVLIRSRPNAQSEAGYGQPAEEPGERRSLVWFAKRTVNNLLRSVPNVRYVLHKFHCIEGVRSGDAKQASRYNAAHFLLFVHFVMACLHRRSHLRAVGEAELSYPFCRDRCDAPAPSGPAAKALIRLEELKRRLLQPRYDSIVVPDTELVNFDPRDVMQIRIEHAQRGREVEKLKEKLVELQQELTEGGTRLVKCERGLAVEKDKRVAAEQLAAQLRKEKHEVAVGATRIEEELASMKVTASRLKESGTQAQIEADELRAQAGKQKALIQSLRGELEQSRQEVEIRGTERNKQDNRIQEENAGREKVMKEMERAMRRSMELLGVIEDKAWRLPEREHHELKQVLAGWLDWAVPKQA